MDEDWDVLLSFLPQDWRELAQDTGALKGLRKDKTVDNLLRTLLLHLGCGHSLRETVVRARQAHLADLSDVALLKRLKKSKGWLHALCVRLFAVDAVLQQVHGGGVAQHMWGDAFLLQRGAYGPCNGQMLGEQVVESVVTEKAAALIREDGGVRFAAKFLQPVPQRCRRVLA